jgi:alkaline phosphatase D
MLGPIVGGLSHSRANLWGRIARPETEPQVLHGWLGRKPDLSDASLAGRSWPLSPQQGYAGVAPLENLSPLTRYHYALTLSAVPPPPAGGPLPGGAYPSFTTFPAPGDTASFSFAFGSCFRPAQQGGGRIFTYLEQARQDEILRFILLIGDQIYADAFRHNGLGKVAETLDEYRAVYQHTWSQEPLRKLFYNLPAFMTLDDHEVDDDWRWIDLERSRAHIPWWNHLLRMLQGRPLSEGHLPLQRVRDALQAYWEHQGMHAPALMQPLALNPAGQFDLPASDPGSLAYTFEYGQAAFFVLDTRTMRVRRGKLKIMLGDGQWQALKDWLLRVKDAYPLKFLVSSCSLLLSMWVDIARDRWSGFIEERERLLCFLAEEQIRGVYMLTGDLHSAHAIRAELSASAGQTLPLWEFCSSPFEQDTNWLARRTYTPIHSQVLKSQDCRFIVDELNCGVVQVEFDSSDKHHVYFKLYGEKGTVLKQVDASEG